MHRHTGWVCWQFYVEQWGLGGGGKAAGLVWPVLASPFLPTDSPQGMAASTPSLMSSRSLALLHTHARAHYMPAYWHKLPHADICFESLTAELWVILFRYRHEASHHKKSAAAGGKTSHLPAQKSGKVICCVCLGTSCFNNTTTQIGPLHWKVYGLNMFLMLVYEINSFTTRCRGVLLFHYVITASCLKDSSLLAFAFVTVIHWGFQMLLIECLYNTLS